MQINKDRIMDLTNRHFYCTTGITEAAIKTKTNRTKTRSLNFFRKGKRDRFVITSMGKGRFVECVVSSIKLSFCLSLSWAFGSFLASQSVSFSRNNFEVCIFDCNVSDMFTLPSAHARIYSYDKFIYSLVELFNSINLFQNIKFHIYIYIYIRYSVVDNTHKKFEIAMYKN